MLDGEGTFGKENSSYGKIENAIEIFEVLTRFSKFYVKIMQIVVNRLSFSQKSCSMMKFVF